MMLRRHGDVTHTQTPSRTCAITCACACVWDGSARAYASWVDEGRRRCAMEIGRWGLGVVAYAQVRAPARARARMRARALSLIHI
eukprot:11601036-Alexandrium_andersonii.AAC.1